MGPKVLIPALGLAGTVVSVAGASSSSSQPKLVADSPLLNKGLPIEISFKCARLESIWDTRNGDYTLKIKESASEEKLKQLTKDRSVDLEVSLELMSNREGDDIGKVAKERGKAVFATLQYWKTGKGIKVTVTDANSGFVETNLSGSTYFCKNQEIPIEFGGGEESVSEKISLKGLDDKTLVSATSLNKLLRAELTGCNTKNNTTNCDLKLSDVTGAKWSVTVLSKTKFELSLK